MKGFKNTTRTQYFMGGDVGGYAKGGDVKPAMAKASKPAMAKAAKPAMAKAAKPAMAKAPVKKNEGGKIGKMPPIGESVKSGNRVSKMTAAAKMREMEERFGDKKRPSAADSAKSGNRVSSQEAAEARHMGVYNKGGKVAKYAQGGSVRPSASAPVDVNQITNQYFADLGRRVKAGTMTADQARSAQVQFRDQVQKSKTPVTGQMAEAAARNIMKGVMAPEMPTPAPMLIEPPVRVVQPKTTSYVPAHSPLKPPPNPGEIGYLQPPMRTSRPDPNVIQPTIVTANGRVPNPAYTADVAMQRYRASLPTDTYYSPQERQQIMSSIENAYSQPGATGQQVSSAYQNASAAATRARPTVGAPSTQPSMQSTAPMPMGVVQRAPPPLTGFRMGGLAAMPKRGKC